MVVHFLIENFPSDSVNEPQSLDKPLKSIIPSSGQIINSVSAENSMRLKLLKFMNLN